MKGLLSIFLSTEDKTNKRSKFFFFKCASNYFYFYLTLLYKGFSSTFLGIVTAVTITNFFCRTSLWPSTLETKHPFSPYCSVLHLSLLYCLSDYTGNSLRAGVKKLWIPAVWHDICSITWVEWTVEKLTVQVSRGRSGVICRPTDRINIHEIRIPI